MAFQYPANSAEIWRAKLTLATEAFQNGEFPMTEVVFRATLYSLGFRGQEIDSEVNLARAPSGELMRCATLQNGQTE